MKENKIVIQFQQGYVEGYFQDGSTLAWQNNYLSYVSPLSIKTSHSLSSLPIALHSKMNSLLLQLNKYNDFYLMWSSQPSTAPLFKKYKIKQFIWEQKQVKLAQNGIQIRSDDNNARVTLSMDGYMVTVKYLQLTPNKKISNEGNSNAQNTLISTNSSSRNITKALLNKYNYQYVQFPNSKQYIPQILNQYRQVTKVFTIFNIPDRWHYPLHIVTQYALANGIFPAELCYIDFQDNEPQAITPMPPCINILEYQSDESHDIPKILTYGVANNHKQVKWMAVGNMFAVFGDMNVLYDQVGYWFREDNQIIGYKQTNRPNYQYKYKQGFLPFKIRNQGEKERDIKVHLQTFISYCSHNSYVSNLKEKIQRKNAKNGINQIPQQQCIADVGTFKYYAPGLLIGRFVDSVMAYLQNGTDLTIVSHGQTIRIGLLVGSFSKEYQWHTTIMLDMWEKGFNHEQWEQKQSIRQELQRIRIGNEAMLTVCRKYQ